MSSLEKTYTFYCIAKYFGGSLDSGEVLKDFEAETLCEDKRTSKRSPPRRYPFGFNLFYSYSYKDKKIDFLLGYKKSNDFGDLEINENPTVLDKSAIMAAAVLGILLDIKAKSKMIQPKSMSTKRRMPLAVIEERFDAFFSKKVFAIYDTKTGYYKVQF